MVCPGAGIIERFVAGGLDDGGIREMEAHIEGCEECFLRMAAAACDVLPGDRHSLMSRSTLGSRLDRCLKGVSLSETALDDLSRPNASETTRKIIGPYVVNGLLGTGGMSVVYRARHQVSGGEVAIKTVKMPFLASSLAMLRQEIEFLREAQHPSIVSVLDFDLMAEDPWYAMELFEGQTLQAFNRHLWKPASERGSEMSGLLGKPAAGGRLPDILRLFSRLCDPVGFVHGAGMVHGDVKPSNVFLRTEQQPVLMDFGLASRAKGTVGREALDVTGRIRGTLPYIAPETIRGKIPDARADMYALGCMIYESVVGAPPFMSSSGTKIIDMHLSMAPVPASQRVSGVPGELDDLIARLLAKSRNQRFGHASALGPSLMSIADSLSGTATSPKRSIVVSTEAVVPLFRPPMVGREAELSSIMDRVQNAQRTSSGAVFLVSGESGIGKTFFTAEMAQQALLVGVPVITSECVPLASKGGNAGADAGTTPLQGFRRFFESLRDRCHEQGNAEVDRLFGPRLGLLTRYLPVLRHLRRASESETAIAEQPLLEGRERIVAAVVDTIAAYASGRSVVLALDDLQWADDLTLAVLERFDEEILSSLPVIVVATYRSEEIHDGIRRLARKSSARGLRLGRLERADIGALIGGMLSMAEPPEELVQYVHEQAEGVPYFAAEYLRTLVAAGALVYEEGAWSIRRDSLERLGGTGESRLSRSLQDLLRGRLQRLAPEVVELLEAGAVVGRRFSLSLISRMVDRSASELPGLMAASVAAQIVESDGFDGYRFLHDKIRETLYAGLAPERRAQLHLDAGRAMESSLTPPDQYGQIGHHLRIGGQPVQALDYFEKAGVHALLMAADADADRFLREALELEATLSPRQPLLRRARWLRQRGEALGGLGLMAESAAMLKDAAGLLGRSLPKSKAGFAFQLAREVVIQAWHRMGPRKVRGPRAGHVELNAEVVRVFKQLHEASFYLGNNADLVLATTVSLNSSERAGPAPNLAVAYTNAAMMAGILPLPKLADRYFALAARTLEAVPDSSAESWLLENEGHYWIWRGNRVRAVTSLDRAIPLARERGLLRRTDEAESLRIFVDVVAGLHTLVLPRASALEQQARRRRDRQIESWALLQKIEAMTLQGEPDAGLAELKRVEQLLPSQGRPEQIWAIGLEADLRDQKGESDVVRTLVERGIELAGRGPLFHSYCISAYDRLAGLAISMRRAPSKKDDLLHLESMAERACALLQQAARVFPIARPPAALHRGALDLVLRRGSRATAIRRWQRAIEVAQELTLPYHELRLRAATLAREERYPTSTDPDPRIRELAQILQLGPGTATGTGTTGTGSMGALLDGSVEIERKGEQPSE